jgi:hypothetical protein
LNHVKDEPHPLGAVATGGDEATLLIELDKAGGRHGDADGWAA